MESPKTLYLIDDDIDDLDFFCEAVTSIDPSIICVKATDSEAALKAFQQHDVPIPDLIFLDLNMPLIDGRRLLAELKTLRPYSNVPVIIYSTSSHPKDIEETKQLGAASFLTKPYSQIELIASLTDLLENQWRATPLLINDEGPLINEG